MGATSNPRPGIRAEGAPDSSIRWAPAPILELITLRSNRRPPLFSWTAVRCAVALSCTLSCLVVVTHPVPPVCDQCLRRECLRLTPGRSLLLRLFVSSILHLSEDHPRLLSDAYANFRSTCANRDPQNSRTRGVWSFSWRIMPLSAQKQRERRAAQRAAEAQDAARGQRNRPAPSRC